MDKEVSALFLSIIVNLIMTILLVIMFTS